MSGRKRLILGFVLGLFWGFAPLPASVGVLFAADDGMDTEIRKTDRPDAPELAGASAWINAEKPVTIADLKGKVVLLDFWTFGCINCMHVIPDLKKLEEKYGKELAVIGVHSAKFSNEKSTENIRKAAQRYGLEHPIANDNGFKIWDSYGVSSWPTLVLIDPSGKFLGRVGGEGNYEILDKYIAHTIKIFDEKKLIDRTKTIGKPEKLVTPVLKFPGKIIAQDKRLYIADTKNSRILIASPDGLVSEVIGNGKEAMADGSFEAASFHMPQGLALSGDKLYVADCENHAIRRIDLKQKTVETIAGTGKQVYSNAGGPAKTTPLNSPWDLALSPDGKLMYIAMAGDHRIWQMDLEKNTVDILAGNGHENVVDGPFAAASFAQPSGLSLSGDILYEADSEGSAVRALDLKKKTVSTLIGYPSNERALFIFGDVDGKYGTAQLQHALAVLFHEGILYVADTYNDKIKIIDPKALTAATFLGDGKPGKDDGKAPRFYEPGGLAIMEGKLYIADTDNHLIRAADLKTKTVTTVPIRMKP